MKSFSEIWGEGGADGFKRPSPLKRIPFTDYAVVEKGIINLGLMYEPKFEITKNNDLAYRKLAHFFTGNEMPDLDLTKGIYIYGNKGSGKTLAMKIMKDFTKEIIRNNGFKFYNATEIKQGVTDIKDAYWAVLNYLDGKPTTVFVDDIGTGYDEINTFGTKFNVTEALISERYIHFMRESRFLHVTSNISPLYFQTTYDERIVSRMNEMFNFIEISGPDYRSEK